MILLIRAYSHDQIQPIHVEAFDRNERLPVTSHRTDCRCIPTSTDYCYELAQKLGLGRKTGKGYLRFEHGHIDTEYIYPTPQKRNK